MSDISKINEDFTFLGLLCYTGFPGGSDSKEFACKVGELCSIPGLGRFPGKGNGYPFQYFGQENSVTRGA